MIASLAAIAMISGTEAPVNLSLRESAGVKLVYRTSLTYTIRFAPGAEPEIPRVDPPAGQKQPAPKHSVTFYSTTFVEHLKWDGSNLLTDIRTWSDEKESEGWLANPENQPQGTTQGGGFGRRERNGAWTQVPRTTDFAPELPLPVYPGSQVKPGAVWSAKVPFEGTLQDVKSTYVGREDRNGISCARIEVTGLTFSRLAGSGPVTVWVDPTNGRTIRIEGLFRKSENNTLASIHYVRSLLREDSGPKPKPAAGKP